MTDDDSTEPGYKCHCKNKTNLITLWRSYITVNGGYIKLREFQLAANGDRHLRLAYPTENLIKIKFRDIRGWHGCGHFFVNADDHVDLKESDNKLTVYVNGQPATPVDPPASIEEEDSAEVE
ncbi:hypothetical protein [Undibacterium sp.]|uniref:hypothetical protein n=1 Tax=Undibacterium sp. TaxID=1914977 RepID=UPI00374CBF31